MLRLGPLTVSSKRTEPQHWSTMWIRKSTAHHHWIDLVSPRNLYYPLGPSPWHPHTHLVQAAHSYWTQGRWEGVYWYVVCPAVLSNDPSQTGIAAQGVVGMDGGAPAAGPSMHCAGPGHMGILIRYVLCCVSLCELHAAIIVPGLGCAISAFADFHTFIL